jgi:hypothetical protein
MMLRTSGDCGDNATNFCILFDGGEFLATMKEA